MPEKTAVSEIPHSEEQKKKRRSTRVKQAVPVIVTGSDALGRRFREHTVTASVNCHGCKILSKHYLLTGAKVELEVLSPHPDGKPRKVGARVAWTERPKSLTDPFQVGVELDTPGNIWGLEFPPEDWFPFPGDEPPVKPAAETAARPALRVIERPAPSTDVPTPPREQSEVIEEEITLPTTPEMSGAVAEPAVRDGMRELQGALEEALSEIERAAAKWENELRERLHTELETELDKWTSKLETRIDGMLEPALATGQSRVAQHAEQASASLEQVQDKLNTALSQFEQQIAQAAQSALAKCEVVQSKFQQQSQQAALVQQTLASATAQAEAVLAELQQRAAEAQSVQQKQLEVLEQKFAALVTEHSTRLEQAANGVLEKLTGKLELSAERIAPQMAERLLAGLEEQVSIRLEEVHRAANAHLEQHRHQLATEIEKVVDPQLSRITEMADRLAEIENRAHQIWTEQQVRLASLTEQAIEKAQAGLHAEIKRYLENQSHSIRETLSEHIKEYEEKVTNLTCTGYEGLLRASEWYQKKATAGMDAALKQHLDRASSELHARAAELSQRFTSELERLSRGFIEHTRELLEAESVAAVKNTHARFEETTEQAAASFSGRIQEQAEIKAAQFAHELARHAQQQCERTAQAAEEIANQTQQRMQEQREKAVQRAAEAAQEELARALDAKLVEMDAAAERKRQAWSEALQHAEEQSLAGYCARLENATNTWLLTSAARLNEHTEALLTQMQQQIGERLREAVREAMSRVLDSLGQPSAPKQ
jgi:hypothetical protein